MPVLRPNSIILSIALPNKTIDRSAAIAASANVFNRAIFDANVVAITMPDCDLIRFTKSFFKDFSDFAGCVTNTLVLSQTNTSKSTQAAFHKLGS